MYILALVLRMSSLIIVVAVLLGLLGVRPAQATLSCTPNVQNVNLGRYTDGPSATTFQVSNCYGGNSGDAVVQCTMFVSNLGGGAGATQPFYLKNNTNRLNFTIRKYAGSDISTGIWYPQSATLSAAGAATITQLFTVLPFSGQSAIAGTYGSTFTVRVKVGLQSAVMSTSRSRSES